MNKADMAKAGGFNLENEKVVKYLHGKYTELGAEEFKKQFDKKTVKAIENYHKSTNTTTNTTNNTTNNNYYAGANPKMAKLVSA